MEYSGNGPSASGHRHHADGAQDIRKAVGCMREGHGPGCPECREFLTRLRTRVEVARRLRLLSTDAAVCAVCTERAFARIREDVLSDPLRGDVVSVAYIAGVVDVTVCEQFVADLRSGQNDAWRACNLQLLQHACAQFGHGFGAPSADTEIKAASATVFTGETSERERELIWEAQDIARRGMLRHFRQSKEVLTIEGLMYIVVENAVKSVKRTLKRKGDFAGDENPDRAITLSALTMGSGQDGEDGPSFEIAAPDDTAGQALEESETDIRERLIRRLASFFEEETSHRKQTTTPRQRAGMIIDALTDPDLDGREIARRYGVKRSFVYVQVNRFRDLLKDPAWRDRLIRLFGADPADWQLPPAGAFSQPPATDTLAPPPAADVADPADAADAEGTPRRSLNASPDRRARADAQAPADTHGSYGKHADSPVPLSGAEDADG